MTARPTPSALHQVRAAIRANALPGVLLYVFMMRAGLVDQSLGDAGRGQG
mgnify:CR=1 FL=1